MADAFYENYRNILLGGGTNGPVDLNADDIRIILYDEGADPLALTDDTLDDILAGAREAVSAAVPAPTVGGAPGIGAFDHGDVTFSAVTGVSVESLTYYKHSGVETTSPLICNIDSATGLPVTPNGGDITWAPAVGGVFQIT